MWAADISTHPHFFTKFHQSENQKQPASYMYRLQPQKMTSLTHFFLNTPLLNHYWYNSDFFISALYSNARGQCLRVALPMHALFQSNPLPETLPKQIPEPVIKAAVSLVNLCIQHTAIIAGRNVTNGQIGKSPELQKTTVPLTQLQSEDEKTTTICFNTARSHYQCH